MSVTMEPFVALTLLSSLLFACGNVLQKKGVPAWIQPLSVKALVGRPLKFAGSLACSPVWTVGFAVTIAAVVIETQALGSGDVSVVKPLSRIQGVFVLLIAISLLRERLVPLEWIGVVAMISGAVMLGFEPSDSIFYAPSTVVSWTAAGGVVFAVVLLVVLTDRGLAPFPAEFGLGLASGALFGLGDVMMKVGTEVARDPTGSFDLTTGEAVRSLLSTSEFYLSMLATAGAFMLQQTAFSRGRVSLIVPMIGTSGTVLVALLGASLLREPLGSARILAISGMIAGAVLLSVSEKPASPSSMTTVRRRLPE